MNDGIELRSIQGDDRPELFERVASLHSDLIHGGILALLGKQFLASLYREIASCRWGSVFVATRDGSIVGFVAGAADIWQCACGLSTRGYLRLGGLFLRRLAKPGVLAKACDAFAYPFRQLQSGSKAVSDGMHRAELLAIAVARDAQRSGVGRMLVGALEDFLKPHAKQYFVSTNIEEAQSNAFYRSLGFAEVGWKKHHGLVLQTYMKRLD